ncbi:MAG: pilus assembly protein TadG-related protein [Pseudomonadota bacterium]
MAHRLPPGLDDGGWVAMFAGVVMPAAVLCALGVMDLGRFVALRDSVQAAADSGAREAVRGLAEEAVKQRIRASLEAQAAGLGQWESLTVSLSDADATFATVEVSVSFAGLLPYGSAPMVIGQGRARAFCVPPASRWVPVTEACSEGQSGSVSYEQEEEGFCSSPTSAPGWRATQNRQNTVSTCDGG